MGEITDISWTDATYNVARGCTIVSAGCAYCYMMRDGDRWGYNGHEVQKTKSVFNMPLKYKKTESDVWPGKPLIFTSSLTDFFHEGIDSFRDEAWEIIRKCPHLTFQILTKRPERIKQCLPNDWEDGYDNVWLGISIESEAYLHRIETLSKIPCKTRFISAEPLLSHIDFNFMSTELGHHSIHWVIIGGESGNGTKPKDTSVKYGYRECDIEWIESIIGQCQLSGIPVFVKQLGTHLAKTMKLKSRTGAVMNEWPSNIQIRQFPDHNEH